MRLACTVVLVRESDDGLETLLLQRTPAAAFLGGFHVFPGGALVPDDHEAARKRLIGITAAQANARLALSSDASAFWIAAVRETFEECGILLARDANARTLGASRVSALAAGREALNAGTRSFAEWLEHHDLCVAGDDFAYFDHWITPPERPRRFDTRFFLARAPEGQPASPDGIETVDARWVRPADALSLAEAGSMRIANATQVVLERLAASRDVDAALASARALATIACNRPCFAQGREGKRMFMRGDAPYHEIHWSDPHESTLATYDLRAGVVTRLDRWVTRVVAPNPGPMTGPGTNTYLVGDRELAVIDPGPRDERHLAAILALGGDRIRWILCTHAHHDHSPAAMMLARATGAQRIGMPPPVSHRHDQTFVPDRVVADGETMQLGDVVLTALHTPGHAPNHLCFRLDATGMLFTGDHVMQGSTVVITPPEGNMGDYLDSLQRLLDVDIAIIAPGHGYLIGEAHDEVRRLIEHRNWREARVLEALARQRAADVESLVDDVYPDLRPVLRAPAMQSLRAHLLKLVDDGRAVIDGDRYRIA
jgi:glyoxylase-like metal-dependent hydrolase (beta-lactamase superfamily II)/8-oxo-dGTP pyrophosphatase MutT (NUDIX family)